MEGDPIMSLIAGFLPTSSSPSSSTPPPTSSPSASSMTAGTQDDSLLPPPAGGCYPTPRVPRRRIVHMICFSKDRAFQLDQLLVSSARHLLLAREDGSGGEEVPSVRLRVSVLYLASSAADSPKSAATRAATHPGKTRASPLSSPPRTGRTIQDSYDLIRSRHPGVRFVQEKPGEFCDQLRTLVGEGKDEGVEIETGMGTGEGTGRKGEDGFEPEELEGAGDDEVFVLFAVDDMFFYRDFELPAALRLLATDSSTLCVHLRLHPCITWSHTSGSPSIVPPLFPTYREAISSRGVTTGTCGDGIEGGDVGKGGSRSVNGSRRKMSDDSAAADFGLLTFTRGEGTGEWDYPWDLTGGLYRREDAVAVLDGIVSHYGKQAAANPNLLEYHGCALLQRRERLQGRVSGICGDGISSDSTRAAASAATKTTPAAAAVTAGLEAVMTAPRCSCPGVAVVSSLAVNRVQNTYTTPVYVSREGGVQDLDRKLWSATSGSRPLFPRTTGIQDFVQATGGGGAGAGADGRDVERDAAVTEDDSRAQAVSGVQKGEAVMRGLFQVAGARSRRGVVDGGGGGFDGQAYRRRAFNSVHVGELWFDKGDGGGNHTEGDEPATSSEVITAAMTTTRRTCNSHTSRDGSSDNHLKVNNYAASDQHDSHHESCSVTVLLPVRNGGDHLLDALESVISSAREMPSGWGVEILIIDDGSDDGAVERAILAVADYVGGSTTAVGHTEKRATSKIQGPASGEDGKAGGKRVVGVRAGERQERCDTGGVAERMIGGSVGNERSGLRQTSSRAAGSSGSVVLRVIRHDQTLGLAESLNEGLREARTDLVARMDADDVCMPGRLRKQVAFMLEHPHISVLGTSVALFSGQTIRGSSSSSSNGGGGGGDDDSCEHGENQHQHYRQQRQQREGDRAEWEIKNPRKQRERLPNANARVQLEPRVVHLPVSGVQRVARHPTDPAFLAWSMLFGCSVAHPSVMLRRDRVLEAGGYDPATEPAEDYDLWLRISAGTPGCVANLGEVLLGLRKHEKNLSRQKRLEQRVVADAAAARAMTHLLSKQKQPQPQQQRGARDDSVVEPEQGAEPLMATVMPAQAATIRRPDSASRAEDLAEAIHLLGNLGAVAMAEAMGAQPLHADTMNVLPSKPVKQSHCAPTLQAVAPHDPGKINDNISNDSSSSSSSNYSKNSENNNDGCDYDDRRNRIGASGTRDRGQEEDADGAGYTGQRRDREMIARDVEARMAAMAVHAMSRFGAGAAPALHEYRRRFPDRPLLFALGGGTGGLR